jgi:hypothetical protein
VGPVTAAVCTGTGRLAADPTRCSSCNCKGELKSAKHSCQPPQDRTKNKIQYLDSFATATRGSELAFTMFCIILRESEFVFMDMKSTECFKGLLVLRTNSKQESIVNTDMLTLEMQVDPTKVSFVIYSSKYGLIF